jgi:hypothetical protein
MIRIITGEGGKLKRIDQCSGQEFRGKLVQAYPKSINISIIRRVEET